jgi:hypothetical protein
VSYRPSQEERGICIAVAKELGMLLVKNGMGNDGTSERKQDDQN